MSNEIPDITVQLNEISSISVVSRDSNNYLISRKDDKNNIILQLKKIGNPNYPFGMSLYYGPFSEEVISQKLTNSEKLFCHITIASPDIVKGLHYLFRSLDSFYKEFE